MKKTITLFLTLCLAVCAVSCTGETAETSSEKGSQEVSSAISTETSTETSSETSSEITASAPVSSDAGSSQGVSSDAVSSRYVTSRERLTVQYMYGDGPIEPVVPDTLPTYKKGSLELSPHDETIGPAPANRKYRIIYYSGPYAEWEKELLRLRSGEEGDENEQDIIAAVSVAESLIGQSEPDYVRYPQERDEMYMVTLIKKYNITREEMEALIEVRITEIKDFYALKPVEEVINKTEGFELPNLDIIYTLDNEIINEYYLYG